MDTCLSPHFAHSSFVPSIACPGCKKPGSPQQKLRFLRISPQDAVARVLVAALERCHHSRMKFLTELRTENKSSY